MILKFYIFVKYYINLHGQSKYKLIVKNWTKSGKQSFTEIKNAIINWNISINNDTINIFIKYLIKSLIEIFKSINNINQHQNIINDVYFLLKNDLRQQLTLKKKINDIQ